MAKAALRTGVWTPDDVRELRRLFRSHPTREIAEKLGRPVEAVKKKASRLGLLKGSRYLRGLGRRR